MMVVDVNEKSYKSYANEENAIKAIKKAGLDHLRYMLPYNKEGRVVPFFLGNCVEYVRVVHLGWPIIGFTRHT